MPQDLLQISLEHHRAGRLQQAQAGYVQILDKEPTNADAMHWLGVLYWQGGQIKEAVEWLARASSLRPRDAAFAHNLGQAYLRDSQLDAAVGAFERAVEAEPGRFESIMGLATARLTRQASPDAQAAITLLQAAIPQDWSNAPADSLELRRLLIRAYLMAGQTAQAVQAARQIVNKSAPDAFSYYQLAAAQHAAGNAAEARIALNKALEIRADWAAAWRALAVLHAEQRRWAESAAMYGRAIKAQPSDPASYQGLGRVLQEMGQPKQAIAAFRDAVRASRGEFGAIAPPPPTSIAELERRLTPNERQAQFHYALAARSNFFPPPLVPHQAISGLFDQYADHFEEDLVGKLSYHLPELIARYVAELWDDKPMDMLDLGCGTGLCGAFLRPMAARLWGVDLSPAMIDRARQRNVYDQLETGDLVTTLRSYPGHFDLLVAADVLIYTGDLFPVFAAAAAALRPGGMFIFSVEAGGGDRFNLVQRSRRYTHAKSYLEKLAAMHGMETLRLDYVAARYEAGKPVPGYLAILRMPGK